MTDHRYPQPGRNTAPFWRRLTQQVALGGAGALGAAAFAWMRAWLEGMKG